MRELAWGRIKSNIDMLLPGLLGRHLIDTVRPGYIAFPGILATEERGKK